MRAFGRDLIRGGHYGQRSCEPRQQAEHMAAPTNAAKREESSCQLGAVHTWHIASFRWDAEFGRYRGIADSGEPSTRQIYWFTAWIALSRPGMRPEFSNGPNLAR